MSHSNYQKVAGNQNFTGGVEVQGELDANANVNLGGIVAIDGYEFILGGGSAGEGTNSQALSLSKTVSILNSPSASQNQFSLANGTKTGSLKILTNDNGTAVTSLVQFAAAANGPNGKATASLAGVGNSLKLLWNGSSWSSLGFGYEGQDVAVQGTNSASFA